MNANITSLNFICFQKIASYLEDRDVQVLEGLSEKLNNFIKNELKLRDEELERILTSSFKPFRMFNIEVLKEADVYLVAEQHGKGQFEQADLMKHLAARGPLWVLLEGMLPSELCDNAQKDRFMEMFGLNPTLKDNINVTGWDTTDNVETLKRIEAIDNECSEMSLAFSKMSMNTEMSILDIIKKMNEIKNFANKEKSNIYAENFLERTKGMGLAISEIMLKAKSSLTHCDKKVRLLVLAGLAHLDHTRGTDKTNSHLEILYNELDKDHKAVILIPDALSQNK